MIAFVLAALIATCHTRGDLPDPGCTPGAVATTDIATICGTSTRARRSVSAADKRAVLASYGVAWADRRDYEVDHLVSLELGGSNARANLWPEPIDAAKRKDVVENRLHREVCSGAISIAEAQRAIATDWTKAP